MSLYTFTQNTRRSTIIEFRREETRAHTMEPIQSEPRIYADDPFRARFGYQLPRGLREEARGMEWRTFTNAYAPIGNLRISSLESETRRGGMFYYSATMIANQQGQRTTTETQIAATGPVSACTNLLADAGRRVEILEFHQFEIFEATVTFIYTCNNVSRTWAMGFGGNAEQSAAAALSSAAHLLYG
ncbi:acetyl-CoA acetyltransferase [Corynebacterium crudilactis]|uniref:Acetyl-CoA acetyltransferase n=1 Tax=Corynebacterium crudilactis TaxID=1652495 RepID=A0A172QW20_9CORY|nr:acetyl-CoA acetyltransferase [Corynebacterium crudilactis]ANE04902.1 acetyl-CoA acetyltransferase [Corynebacterium crudilactis]